MSSDAVHPGAQREWEGIREGGREGGGKLERGGERIASGTRKAVPFFPVLRFRCAGCGAWDIQRHISQPSGHILCVYGAGDLWQ